jgi:hypothetical protein
MTAITPERAQAIRERIEKRQRDAMARCKHCAEPTENERDLADLLDEREKLLAVVEAVESLHRPTRVYDECTHDDCQAEQIEVYDYMACADSQIGWGCETCCYDDEFPIEDCPHGADHRGVTEADSCPTHAAVRAYRAATTGEAGNG